MFNRLASVLYPHLCYASALRSIHRLNAGTHLKKSGSGSWGMHSLRDQEWFLILITGGLAPRPWSLQMVRRKSALASR